ncbi:hypothetical protein LZ30DRAFT_810521 [Colletotrichum cereale]|nr:hypothetical protein LZ30DRAFT_810521 [Colletotrichum cereale]
MFIARASLFIITTIHEIRSTIKSSDVFPVARINYHYREKSYDQEIILLRKDQYYTRNYWRYFTKELTQTKKMSRQSIIYLIHHIFLTPQLPQENDFSVENEAALFQCLCKAVTKFRDFVPSEMREVVEVAAGMMNNMACVHQPLGDTVAVDEGKLLEMLHELSKTARVISLDIRAQNAGVLITKVNDSVHFEAFELSPTNEAVITTIGRLRRNFPGVGAVVGLETFNDAGFKETLASTLAKMSSQPAAETQPRAKKAGKLHDESRDATNPKMITQLLYSFLQALGSPLKTERIWKNTRDEVNWAHCLLPWRRSPTWLLVRVCLQLVFGRLATQAGRSEKSLYKTFMAFMMAEVLRLGLRERYELPSDLVLSMVAKLSRRLLKHTTNAAPAAIDHVRQTMCQANEVLSNRWYEIRLKDTPGFGNELESLKTLDFEKDSVMHLTDLDNFLASLPKRNTKTTGSVFSPSWKMSRYESSGLPSRVEIPDRDHLSLHLASFEAWVDKYLQAWFAEQSGEGIFRVVLPLRSLLESYHDAASSFYTGNPESTSIMLLTILDLWIVCDKATVLKHPLLKDYNPEVPLDLFENLLLPKKRHMERLHAAELYLAERLRNCKSISSAPNIYTTFGTSTCFSARYFDQSSEHQILRGEIEEKARKDREAKKRELCKLKHEYDNLMERYHASSCEYYDTLHWRGYPDTRHSGSCTRCSLLKCANGLRIVIHEGPLPRNSTELKSTVFELSVPETFGNWREVSVYFLFTVLKATLGSSQTPRAQFQLERYEGLSRFFRKTVSQQYVGPLSQDKPHMNTHRKKIPVATATENTVCLDNGLNYAYYMNRQNVFLTSFGFTDTIPEECTYHLSSASKAIQQYLFRPRSKPNGPSQNTAIAKLHQCPDGMTIEEYKALASIPIGYRLQWKNILVQLFSPSVDFKKRDTAIVIQQCVYQAGPPSGCVLRSAHTICQEKGFASRMLEGLFEAIQLFEENWQSLAALGTFTTLSRRLISLAHCPDTQKECLRFLSKARNVLFSWAQILKCKTQGSSDDQERLEFQRRALEAYLMCADTFNVDETFQDAVFLSDSSISVFMQCSIGIHEGSQTLLASLETPIRHLYSRWQRTSYLHCSLLARKVVTEGSSALDDAISASWSVYEPSRHWMTLPEAHNTWLTSNTASPTPMVVHFNLITGELLVDGSPLDHLPQQYLKHNSYQYLFGRLSLEIMPTPVPGMQFSSKRRYAEYDVHLGLGHVSKGSGADLLVQASKGESSYELVPKRCLKGSLPTRFVDEYVHWWDCKKKCVEFRDITAPWKHTTSHWRLSKHASGNNWKLTRCDSTLVDVRSRSAKLISAIFRPLEDPFWIHIIYTKSDSSVSVELPRALLEFSHTSGHSSIHSRQFRGMSVDSDQSVGALVGLKDKLVLKSDQSGQCEIPACRKVLVLEGQVSFAKTNGHVEVHIARGVPTVHAYQVDNRLARLVSNNSLQSHLFLAYLHALTSFVLPDPLTEKTGTEQALSILNSALVRSFYILTPHNVALLDQLAQLTPGRSYYPANERVMQTVTWSSQLNFLAQHGLFYEQVKSIFKQVERSKFFHPDLYVEPPKLEKVEFDLLKRDSIRSSTFRVSGFGAESYSLDHDVLYTTRDRDTSSKRSWVFAIARLALSNEPVLVEPLPSDMASYLWTLLDKGSPVLGRHCAPPTNNITYNAELLLQPSKFIATNWIWLQRELGTSVNKYRSAIWLATLAFATKPDMAVLQTLALFRTDGDIAGILPPAGNQFDLRSGVSFRTTRIHRCLERHEVCLTEDSGVNLERSKNETDYLHYQRRLALFEKKRDRAVTSLMDVLTKQWPCSTPTIPPKHVDATLWRQYMRLDAIVSDIAPLFKTWHDNLQFKRYIQEITGKIPSRIVTQDFPRPLLVTLESAYSLIPRFISAETMFRDSTPPSIAGENWILDFESFPKSQRRNYQLPNLLSSLCKKTSGEYQEEYVENLRSSLIALQQRQLTNDCKTLPQTCTKEKLGEYLHAWRSRTEELQSLIMGTVLGLQASDPTGSFTKVYDFYQRPRLSASSLLQRLNHVYRDLTPPKWTECLIQFGMAMSQLQRAERMLASLGDSAALINELQNPGHTNWSPKEFPDTLLLEIESGIMVREVQESIADKMRSPPGNNNVVMQLNMGEGKSSVIVQMVVAAIADGSNLVRVIVAKPQSKQMFQMMVSKLGGLLNRRVFHLPFSRAVKIGPSEAEAIHAILKDCMDSKGVLLVQPEHLLSFQLMGIETAISGKGEVSASLVKTKDFLDRVSRDIVDESDENFSVKFELVYTMGTQRPVEHSPDRWVCIHQVLNVVRKFLPEIQKNDPSSVEISTRHQGSFPRTRILRESAKRILLELVSHHLSRVGARGLPMASHSSLQHAVYTYISKDNLSQSEIDAVESSELWSVSTRSTLLLLRGLIACQILSFVFCQKRWRVDYGPDHKRVPSTRLAVPYRAKDNPSARSEFSHPDVIITLTSLSYYYGGLDDSEILLSFEHLVRSDQADMEYSVWVLDSNQLPVAFQQLSGINLEDRLLCVEQVFPCFRYSKATVDYFLQHLVFPKEIKEFPHKLSASGWDIGAPKRNPTTGFSGTNDSRAFLPLSVKQLDLPDQKPTNALVLEYLLQPENSVALMPAARSDTKSDAETLLEMVVQLDPPARVILDVGAQILELDNLGVAKRWLSMIDDEEKTQAVIFCDENDHMCVVDRRNRIESLHTSSFANQTDVCLVFLDEAHTRGTDLKLPEDYRAAVTLGANLTKDRLVQACMRMRKLGKGQSVIFCVPDEIRQKIETRTQSVDTAITVARILEWSISETFADFQRGIWLWANQGRRYQRNTALWNEARANGVTELSNEHAGKFLEDEAQTIEMRYSPSCRFAAPQLSPNNEHTVDEITKRLLQFGGLNPESTTFREEQERELSPEVEEERQVQKPPAATPAKHTIHPDVRAFISEGVLPPQSTAFLAAFRALADTSAAKYYDVTKFNPGLLVTQDFARTIIPLGKDHTADLFQRPVQWVLRSASSSCTIETAIVISPYEAQELLPDIRNSQRVSLHLYAPRPNMGYRSLDTLDLYTTPIQSSKRPLPDLFLTELNLFSGQLYMKSMKEYQSICRFLGLRIPDQEVNESDDHVYSAHVTSSEAAHLHQFMRVLLMKIRRNCQSIDKTHLGRILEYRALEVSDFVDNRVM